MAEPSLGTIRRAQAGDGQALIDLVEGQQTFVYSIAMGVMRNPADAADATQESFVRLLRSLNSYRGETKFTTWLYRLVTNICLDGLRRRGRPVESLDLSYGDDEEDSPATRLAADDRWTEPETRLEIGESVDEVRRALERLPLPQRLALTMHYFDDMSYEDVALALDVPLNTVKSHIRRGKERMAALLARPLPSPRREPCAALT